MTARRPSPPKRPIHQDKDLDKFVKKAWEAKWRCVRKKNNYIYCYPPSGEGPVVVKSTPSSSRYPKNLEKLFERAGLEL
jgi:hypothetical protein